ncbi:ubiquitin C-terminal hydrolase [Arthroderma uncinatum]|uniref:ubiquitin C-terminal hydrolase n=1 Tax=Arthroderma uncinatum TaxID=74035 RepID=UPI00144AF46C|nr:ubiquitin C-terminal hydrolase [Arthroderma uncinatum]KAF3483405.1 ubiquitin C-terminal hydrolase [Arthroderma uncinatum]
MNSYPGYHYPPKQRSSIRGNHHDPLSRHPSDRSSIVYALVSLASIYFLLYTFGLSPFTVPRFFWKIIVYLTPSRLVAALDKERAQNTSTAGETASSGYRSLREKSEAMQRIIGCGANSILPAFPRSRAYSSLSSVLLGSNEVHPPGLGNWDNSCYQNSIIQGLASLRSLREFLGSNIQNLGHRHFLSTHIALRVIIDKLNDPENAGQKLWLPAELKSMCSWQQQDAQEYFSIIADQIDKEIHEASKGVTSDMGLKLIPQPSLRREVTPSTPPETSEEKQATSEPDTDRNSLPYCSPLEGSLAQRVGCMECGWTEGLSLIPFNCLTVTLGKNWEYDIRECLDEYTSLESIEGVECAKCTLQRTQTQLEQLLVKLDPVEESTDETDSTKLNEALRRNAEARLSAVQESLQAEDFSEKTLKEKCHISPRNHVASTKSKQAVIARPPKSLIIHVNRSVFDEVTGALRKNYADVRFPKSLDLDEWCLGTMPTGDSKDTIETWGVDPSESMLPRPESEINSLNRRYELQAAITHYGRHENGHYICYRKYSVDAFPIEVPQAVLEADGGKEKKEHWFRLSDEDVSLVSERSVLAQGGVFMLYYELIDPLPAVTGAISQAQLSVAPFAENGIPLEEIQHNSDGATKIVRNADNAPNAQAEGPVWSKRPNTDSMSSHTSSSSEDTNPSSANEEPSIASSAQQLASAMRTANPQNQNQNLDPHENPNTSSMSPLIRAL